MEEKKDLSDIQHTATVQDYQNQYDTNTSFKQ